VIILTVEHGNEKAPPETSEKQMKLMAQVLLAERLKLMLHRETRVFPVYELLVSKNGPKLQRAALMQKAVAVQ
jgi:uncharacterized protein (TIGR03435 family)